MVDSMKKKTFAIIQARMGSTRLPGKVLRELCGKPMLHHIVQRIKQVESIDTIMLATSICQEDTAVEVFADSVEIPCFRGSEEDVLARFYEAARLLDGKENDVILRLTADIISELKARK